MKKTIIILFVFFILSCIEKEREDCLKVCLESFPSNFDPRYALDQSSDRVLSLIHRGLFTTNEKMEPVGDIAESYSFKNDKTLNIKLQKNIFFSDGKRLDSDDVIFTIESILYGNLVSPKRGELAVVKEIRKIDETNFEIELKKPFAPFLTLLNFGIVENKTIFDPEKIPLGCGYFKINSIKRGKEIFLEENKFSETKPKVKKVLLKVIEDPTVRSLELLRGSIDIVVNDLPYDSIKSFKKRGFNVLSQNGTNYSYIGINCRKSPLDKKEVRKAIAMSIQREKILKNIIQGFGREATGLISPENWAYFKTSNPPYDPQLADKILDSIGLKKNEKKIRFKLSYKTSMNKTSRFVAEAVSENLKQIGIELEIQTLEWGTFYEDIKRGSFDLFSLNWIGIKDPDAFRFRFDSEMIPPFGFNRGGYKNVKIDQILRNAVEELDVEKRKKFYDEIQKILSDDCPYINLWWPNIVVVTNRKVKPFKVPSDGNFIFLKDIEFYS